jgi:hypothetical protein
MEKSDEAVCVKNKELTPYPLFAAGQPVTSPAVDAGSGSASQMNLAARTTRSDSRPDSGVVDMGFHYPLFYPIFLTPLRQIINPRKSWTAKLNKNRVARIQRSGPTFPKNFFHGWVCIESYTQPSGFLDKPIILLIEYTRIGIPGGIARKTVALSGKRSPC